jgi:septal ring factor EnvC (AmiA/AmiB activator)
MKKLLLVLCLLSFATTSFGQFWKPKPKPTPVPVRVAEPVQSPMNNLQEARKIIKELNSELVLAKSENAKLKINITNANKTVADAEKNVVAVQKQADLLKEWGIQKQKEAFEWLEKYNNAVKRYHRLKWIAAIIAAAGGVLLGLQFMAFAPPPYNLFIPIGGAGLFGALVWFFL